VYPVNENTGFDGRQFLWVCGQIFNTQSALYYQPFGEALMVQHSTTDEFELKVAGWGEEGNRTQLLRCKTCKGDCKNLVSGE
jgi:hypothetical protein